MSAPRRLAQLAQPVKLNDTASAARADLDDASVRAALDGRRR